MQSDQPETFPHLVDATAARHGGKTFLHRRTSLGGEPVTFRGLRDEVRAVAAGLVAAGIGRGDRVALIAENRFEWLVADLACAYVGAVDVPRGTDTSPRELEFILGHAGCRLALVETSQVADTLRARRPALPELDDVLTLTGEDGSDGSLAGLRERGRELLDADPQRLDARAAEVTPDDLLTIVYTSGTTAEPKGVMLTHANVAKNIAMVRTVLDFDDGDEFLSVLPAWHAYERIMDYVAFACGSGLTYTDRRRLKDDLRTVRPTVFAAVPRVWESVHDGIVNHCLKQQGFRGRLLQSVLRTCREVGGGTRNPMRRVLHMAYARSILPKFRAATGGRLRVAVSGGGALPAHVDRTMLGMGIPILNGYGLTETSPVVCVRTPAENRPVTIGRPLPETEIQIRDEAGNVLPVGRSGLIWIRGPQVMRGYYRNPERTREVLDADGWFNSGDLGSIDPDGHVRITGRAKDTIVLAGGENVEPEPIETVLKTSPLIDQAIVVGQDRKTLGALIVPMVEQLEQAVPRDRWDLQGTRLRGDEVQRLFRRELDGLLSAAEGFRPVENVARFRVILEPMSPENGQLTQTLKVKRHVVTERHGALIDEMFA